MSASGARDAIILVLIVSMGCVGMRASERGERASEDRSDAAEARSKESTMMRGPLKRRYLLGRYGFGVANFSQPCTERYRYSWRGRSAPLEASWSWTMGAVSETISQVQLNSQPG